VGLGRLAAVSLSIAIIIAASIASASSLYDGEDSPEYMVKGYVVIYLEDTWPTIYLYINYSAGPGSLLVDLPAEPYGDSIEVVGGSAVSAVYMGYLYSLILVNASEGSVVLRYRGVYSYGDGVRMLEIRNTSWSSYIELVSRRGAEISGLPRGVVGYSEGEYTRYRIDHLEGDIVVALKYTDLSKWVEAAGLILGTSAVGVAATYYAIKSHRRRSALSGRVDAIDREILRVIRDLGGEAPTTKIQELTGLPKTTLWRRLRKLERIGYIEIHRIGRGSIARIAGRLKRR